MRYAIAGLLLCAGLWSGTLTLPLQAQGDLDGVYQCEGESPEGEKYSGVVEIAKNGDIWNLRWTFERGTALGIGVLDGDTLSVIFQMQTGAMGVTSYRVERSKGTVKLVGRWTVPGGEPKTYRETLTKQKDGQRPTAPAPQPTGPRV